MWQLTSISTTNLRVFKDSYQPSQGIFIRQYRVLRQEYMDISICGIFHPHLACPAVIEFPLIYSYNLCTQIMS